MVTARQCCTFALLIVCRLIGCTLQALAIVTRRSPEHAALGRAIRKLRLEQSISQEGLAALSGLHRTYVGGIERGERNVSFGNLLKLAAALGVPLSELVALAESLAPARDRRAGAGNRPPLASRWGHE
jgi:DNA-binding XRE family transcriptional regulator